MADIQSATAEEKRKKKKKKSQDNNIMVCPRATIINMSKTDSQTALLIEIPFQLT